MSKRYLENIVIVYISRSQGKIRYKCPRCANNNSKVIPITTRIRRDTRTLSSWPVLLWGIAGYLEKITYLILQIKYYSQKYTYCSSACEIDLSYNFYSPDQRSLTQWERIYSPQQRNYSPEQHYIFLNSRAILPNSFLFPRLAKLFSRLA